MSSSFLASGSSTAGHPNDLSVRKRLKFVLDVVPIVPGWRLLDVGCGNGAYTCALAMKFHGTVVGVEKSLEAISQARILSGGIASVKVRFLNACAEALPVRDERFDFVLMNEVLEHVDDEGLALKEIWRVLVPEGCVALFVPNKWWFADSHGCHLGNRWTVNFMVPLLSWAPSWIRGRVQRARIYTRGQVVRLLESSGFRVLHVGYFWPAVDQLHFGLLRARKVRHFLRRIFGYMEKTPLTWLGMSIFVVAVKRS